MLDKLVELTHELREAGIPVALSEALDATEALRHITPDDPHVVRETIASTTIKNQAHRSQFDVIFDALFMHKAGRVPGPETHEELADLRAEVLETLGGSGEGGIDGLAERAVEAFGRIENSPSRSLYFEYPVTRALDLESLTKSFEDEIEDLDPLDAMVALQRFRARVEELRAAIRREVRRRVADRRGARTVLRHAVRPLPEDADLMSMDPDQVAALRKAIRPLSRKLATRLAAKRKRSQRGALDMRKTVRHSLSTGGVPLDVHLRKRVPHRPEVFVMCDISDSVARFSRFSLMLVHALSVQFSKVRSFAFIDTLDEVTHFFEHEDFITAIDRMNQEARVVSYDGHSDYGNSLEAFVERSGKEVSARTTILILGDARNNFRPTGQGALKKLAESAHRIYWLNPEPVMFWDTGDSAASQYAPHVDDMIEVRNLRQLEDFIAQVL